jgi:hypothetical protein
MLLKLLNGTVDVHKHPEQTTNNQQPTTKTTNNQQQQFHSSLHFKRMTYRYLIEYRYDYTEEG